MTIRNFLLFFSSIFSLIICNMSQSNLQNDIELLKANRKLKGIQLQVSQNHKTIFNINLGQKNENHQLIDNNTMFRIASVSKSFSAVAIMQLVQQNKLQLNQSISSIFDYPIENPYFPGVQITVEMILSHQSTLVQCQPFYSNFAAATANAKTNKQIPNMKQILLKGGKFYDNCLYSNTHKPGTYFDYVNLNFAIAGSIIEIISNKRFDQYMNDNILNSISEGLTEKATYYPPTIFNSNNLGVIYKGVSGQWVPNYDYYPDGKIPVRNFSGYQLGSNGILFGPQGSLRASVSHLTNYAIMLANEGTTKQGAKILTSKSIRQILKARYLYHGQIGGVMSDFHNYGLGIFTTTYMNNDIIFQHEVVKGHIGDAYGLMSAQHFWKQYTLTYIINGALQGYIYDTGTIYQMERMMIHSAVQRYVNQMRALVKQ